MTLDKAQQESLKEGVRAIVGLTFKKEPQDVTNLDVQRVIYGILKAIEDGTGMEAHDTFHGLITGYGLATGLKSYFEVRKPFDVYKDISKLFLNEEDLTMPPNTTLQ